jgi:hypothetical protein
VIISQVGLFYDMNVRPIIESDYQHLVKWGEFWRFQYPGRDFLPDDGLGGLMVCEGETLVCGGYIYDTNSGCCWMEWIMSNPAVKKNRKKYINLLIEELSNYAKEKGYKYIFTVAKNENLQGKYIENNFIVGTKNSTEMIKLL